MNHYKKDITEGIQVLTSFLLGYFAVASLLFLYMAVQIYI